VVSGTTAFTTDDGNGQRTPYKMLSIQNLSFSYGMVQALRNVVSWRAGPHHLRDGAQWRR